MVRRFLYRTEASKTRGHYSGFKFTSFFPPFRRQPFPPPPPNTPSSPPKRNINKKSREGGLDQGSLTSSVFFFLLRWLPFLPPPSSTAHKITTLRQLLPGKTVSAGSSHTAARCCTQHTQVFVPRLSHTATPLAGSPTPLSPL